MTFRDDRERVAWERTYDKAIRATVGDADAILYADAKIAAMRERESPRPDDRAEVEEVILAAQEKAEEMEEYSWLACAVRDLKRVRGGK